MYHLIAELSWFIRQFCISNPFELMTKTPCVDVCGMQIPVGTEILNMIASGVLPYFTFAVVGLYYKKGSCPPLGSFLFLVFYLIHNEILEVMCKVNFETSKMIWIISIFVFIHIAILCVKNKIELEWKLIR